MKDLERGREIGRNSATPDVGSAHDRFCVWCGEIIPNQALFKSTKCRNERCKLGVPERSESMRAGWIHCRRCDVFTHNDFNFCSLCGEETFDGAGSRQRFTRCPPQLSQSSPNISNSELNYLCERSETIGRSSMVPDSGVRTYAEAIYEIQNRWKSTHC